MSTLYHLKAERTRLVYQRAAGFRTLAQKTRIAELDGAILAHETLGTHDHEQQHEPGRPEDGRPPLGVR